MISVASPKAPVVALTPTEKRSLRRRRYAGVTFDSVDFSHADFRLTCFRRVTFRRCDFAGADLRGARFEDCVFADCGLAGVRFSHNAFLETVFRGCRSVLAEQRSQLLARGARWIESLRP